MLKLDSMFKANKNVPSVGMSVMNECDEVLYQCCKRDVKCDGMHSVTSSALDLINQTDKTSVI